MCAPVLFKIHPIIKESPFGGKNTLKKEHIVRFCPKHDLPEPLRIEFKVKNYETTLFLKIGTFLVL